MMWYPFLKCSVFPPNDRLFVLQYTSPTHISSCCNNGPSRLCQKQLCLAGVKDRHKISYLFLPSKLAVSLLPLSFSLLLPPLLLSPSAFSPTGRAWRGSAGSTGYCDTVGTGQKCRRTRQFCSVKLPFWTKRWWQKLSQYFYYNFITKYIFCL